MIQQQHTGRSLPAEVAAILRERGALAFSRGLVSTLELLPCLPHAASATRLSPLPAGVLERQGICRLPACAYVCTAAQPRPGQAD